MLFFKLLHRINKSPKTSQNTKIYCIFAKNYHNLNIFSIFRSNRMLVEFRVKNFRSLRDEQTLSLVASKDKAMQDTHTVTSGLKAAPNLLKSAVIYGANASGKSNLIKALQ